MDPLKAIRMAIMVAKTVAPVVEKPLMRKDGGEAIHKSFGGDLSDEIPTNIISNSEESVRDLNEQGFYSGAAEAARRLPNVVGPHDQMMGALRNAKGVKPDEIEHSGIRNRVARHKQSGMGKIHRDDIATMIEEAMPQISESKDNKWHTSYNGKDLYTPGERNYRELLMKLESQDPTKDAFQSSHYSVPNLLAHIRMSDRVQKPKLPRTPKPSKEFSIRTNGSEVTNEVPAWDTGFPGLSVHKSVGEKGYSVSHDHSGMKLIGGIPTYWGAQNYAQQMGPLMDWTEPKETLLQKFRDSEAKKVHTNIQSNALHLEDEFNQPPEDVMKKRGIKKPERYLHIDENQSDWGQHAREHGIMPDDLYDIEQEMREAEASGNWLRQRQVEEKLENFVPKAPFIDKTQKWTDLTAKRALTEAARGNYDGIMWTPGEKQAERYNLSNFANRVLFDPRNDYLKVFDNNNNMILSQHIPKRENIAQYIGKEPAAELMKEENRSQHGVHELQGEGLRVGGHGMINYYNKIYGPTLLKWIQTHDPEAKFESVKIGDKRVDGFPLIRLSDKARESIRKKGFPLFRQGGLVNMRGGETDIAKSSGGPVADPQKAIRKALMVARLMRADGGDAEKSVSADEDSDLSTRITIPATGPKSIKGIVVPRHMLEGKIYAGKGPKAGEKVAGMNEINAARAAVYGDENRDPLSVGQIGKIHHQALTEHFAKPIAQQIAAEKEALARLRAAKHINEDADTLDESEKTDTVKYEDDPYEPWTSKGIAGHALYTSGHGDNEVRHVINTCPGQTVGCGGGISEDGIVDTSKGTCFAPNAESQYVNAAVRRACHAQAKADPAMTRDWIIAHTGSLRNAAQKADKKKKKTMFRPNVVDETDVSSRHVLEGLNEQRAQKGLPPIIANSYGKTNELHDPENGYYVTHSNVGPKVKRGAEISENIGRDRARIRSTILAESSKRIGKGEDFRNKQGNLTPPKNSYMVTNVKRYSDLDRKMQGAITHAKYWSGPRTEQDMSPDEIQEGPEGHFDGEGNPTTPEKSHYGHITIGDNRYDYQRQHILHPRMVSVPVTKKNKKTGVKTTEVKNIPTDSRFKDNDFLPSDEQRFRSKNGKLAGAILMTTPTESTSNLGHETSFTHHVDENTIKHALANNGEYEIDNPLEQEAARGKEYASPQPIEFKKRPKGFASGGSVYWDDDEYSNGLPEQNFYAQAHHAHKGHHEDHDDVTHPAIDRALHLVAKLPRR